MRYPMALLLLVLMATASAGTMPKSLPATRLHRTQGTAAEGSSGLRGVAEAFCVSEGSYQLRSLTSWNGGAVLFCSRRPITAPSPACLTALTPPPCCAAAAPWQSVIDSLLLLSPPWPSEPVSVIRRRLPGFPFPPPAEVGTCAVARCRNECGNAG